MNILNNSNTLNTGSTTPSGKILYTKNDNPQKVTDLHHKLKGALLDITQDQRYSSRRELDASGQSRRFDVAHATLLAAGINNTSVKIVTDKLQAQSQALDEINQVMTDFQNEYAQNSQILGTPADKANRALEKIDFIIRTKNQAGEYIFGGSNPRVNPLSVIDPATGNRIAVSLTQVNNIIGGAFVNNFSDTREDQAIVTVSSRHEIKQGFLHPGMDALIKTIGYLNMFKNVPNYNLQQLGDAQQAQNDARAELGFLVSLELEKAKDAVKVNDKDIEQANNIIEEYNGDMLELASHAKDLLQILSASVSISQATYKSFEILMQNLHP
jgi:hypothetical protein